MNEHIIYKIIDGKGENRRLDKRYVLFEIFVFVMVAVFSFLLTRSMPESSAADMSQFKAGNIMSDAVMRNYTSMTEAEIQTFLKKKNPCEKTASSVSGAKAVTPGTDNGVKYNYQYTYGGKTYHYHVENGKFVCLASESFDGESAAHIIYEAAKDYKINPQVLIVLLEKEQGLITDRWPNTNYQYRSATGYGCPDNAACDSKYYGLKNQVRQAAALFNTVLSGGWTNYPLGNNIIRYSPNASCGSSTVYIENLATSALYRYTPYQPNAAAIKAGTGTAACGAYGNRNFYIYFTDWFGSTQKVQYTYAQNYYNRNKSKTGLLTGEVVCSDKAGKTADLTKDGDYYCYQDFEKGTLFWNTNVKTMVKTESSEVYLDKTNAAYYKGVTDKTKLAGLGQNISGPTTVKEGNSSYQILPFEKGYIKKVNNTYTVVYDTVVAAWAKYKIVLGDIAGEKKTLKNNLIYLACNNGYLVGSDSYGYYAMTSGVFKTWTRSDNLALMGKPNATSSGNNYTGMKWQGFENGYIMGNDQKGWYPSTGKTREEWRKYNFESGKLGFIQSDISATKGGSTYQKYTGGYVVCTNNACYIMPVGVFTAWTRGNNEALMGKPIASTTGNNTTKMQWQKFENGYIMGNDQKGWFPSTGKTREAWAKQNYEMGKLGFYLSDIQTTATGATYQKFQGGYVVITEKYGSFVMSEKVFAAWTRGENEKLMGLPTASASGNNSTKMQWQKFENGYIMGNDQKGWFPSTGKTREEWKKANYEYGKYGFIKSDIVDGCQEYYGGKICTIQETTSSAQASSTLKQ